MEGTLTKYRAMTSIKEQLKEIKFENVPADYATPVVHSFGYLQWGANKLMVDELVRNLALTFGTVVIIVLLLIGDLRVSLAVTVCVVLTVSFVRRLDNVELLT